MSKLVVDALSNRGIANKLGDFKKNFALRRIPRDDAFKRIFGGNFLQ